MNYDKIVIINKNERKKTMKYAQNIRNLREDNDLYQKDIAKILGTSQSYYAQYENGKRPLPIEHLIKLCQYYGVSADYILGLTNNPKPIWANNNIKNNITISGNKKINKIEIK